MTEQTYPDAEGPADGGAGSIAGKHDGGADGGSRTRTGFPPQDFKSCVSTSSTTSARM